MCSPLIVTQPHEGLSLLGGGNQALAGFRLTLTGFGQFAGQADAALVQHHGMRSELLELAGAKAGGKVGATKTFGGGDLRIRGPEARRGELHGNAGPSATLLGGLLGPLAEGEHCLESKAE